MRKLLKALLLSAAATGVAALVLQRFDLDRSEAGNDAPFPGMDPGAMTDDDVEQMLKELGSMLGG